MRNHLKYYKETSDLDEGKDEKNWIWLLRLVQIVLHTGKFPEVLTWEVAIILTNKGWEYCGIVMVKVVWKLITSIINRQPGEDTILHYLFIGYGR